VQIGDIVRIKTDDEEDPAFQKDIDETGYGIVIGFEPRGYQLDRDPDCDVWNDAIVVWPRGGKSWHMRALLEVVSEGR
jgi:hypothetical protein